MNATGWAVRTDQILVRTVGPTRRSALVNWLWAYANVRVMNYHDNDDIEGFWKHQKLSYGAEVIEVVIEEKD